MYTQGIINRLNMRPEYQDFNITYVGALGWWEAIEEELKKAPHARKKNMLYYDLPASFDIETTSFVDGGDKRAIMYHWQMAIGRVVLLGRTWGDFITAISGIMMHNMETKCWLVIYVHNLAYEFQFIRHMFSWGEVFARKPRRPIYARTLVGNIEFRCSYMLSQTSLDTLCKKYQFTAQKLHNYDYNKIRHSETPMTEDEICYCINDVVCLYYYITTEMERNGSIAKIPYTQTGYVRRALKSKCYSRDAAQYGEFKALMKTLTLTSAEYLALKRAYMGGHTHASALYSGELLSNVESYDIASSYPTVMVSELYPMSKGEYMETITLEEYNQMLADHCIVADFRFTRIAAKPDAADHIIPVYKCVTDTGRRVRKEAIIEDNNKLVEANYPITITLTDVDFSLYQQLYNWDTVEITGAYIYKKGVLPKPFVELVIDLYKDKTELKGVTGKEEDYLHAKEMVNSMYGMCVTDILSPEITYTRTGGWGSIMPGLDGVIEKYNNEPQRTLFYPWGVYITAYARRNLINAIIACGDDYVYSDTDSCKILNARRHDDYFAAYNANVTARVEAVLNTHNIPITSAAPKDPKGKSHPLGWFEQDEVYFKFKTLGAKRYLGEVDGRLKMTLAGVSKQNGCEYLNKSGRPFSLFAEDLIFPAEYSGKLAAIYIDTGYSGVIDDGKRVVPYEELSGVYMESVPYALNIAENYLTYLKFCQNRG